MLSVFDVGRVGVEALLFQSGYRTVTGKESNEWGLLRYRLDYPNLEVRQSLNDVLQELTEMFPDEAARCPRQAHQ